VIGRSDTARGRGGEIACRLPSRLGEAHAPLVDLLAVYDDLRGSSDAQTNAISLDL
jgi:hypothetical protein